MSSFTVRVELHNASGQDYELLHARMEQRGFKREITGTDTSGSQGVWALPTAEYDYSSATETAFQVRDVVKAIANTVKSDSWVLVTQVQGNNRAWSTVKLRSTR
jgi:hypothetical protein